VTYLINFYKDESKIVHHQTICQIVMDIFLLWQYVS
jgi:hypothetical protein